MAIKLKQIYICDGCGSEFEQPDQIRIFNEVWNGDKTKSFIRPNQMYCSDCTNIVLDFENKIPETVIILNNKKEKYIRNKKVEDIIEKEEVEDIIEEKEVEDIIEKEEVEDIIEKEEVEDIIEEKEVARFLVLQKIKNTEDEKFFAKHFQYDKIETLKEIINNKTLIGTYFSMDQFVNIEDIDKFEKITAKIINKIIFGVPNIINSEVYVIPELDTVVIEKEKFEIEMQIISSPLPKIIKNKPFKDPIKDIDPAKIMQGFSFKFKTDNDYI